MLSSNNNKNLNDLAANLARQSEQKNFELQAYFEQLVYLETYATLLLNAENNSNQSQQLISNIHIISSTLQNIVKNNKEPSIRSQALFHLNYLGNIYENNSHYESAAQCYEFTSRYKNSVGLFNLARFHYYGLGGCDQNITKATQLINKSKITNEFSSHVQTKYNIQHASLFNRITAGIAGAIGGAIIGALAGAFTAICGIVTAPLFATMIVTGPMMAMFIGFLTGGLALAGLITGAVIGFSNGWEGFADFFASSQKFENNKNSMLLATQCNAVNNPEVKKNHANLSTRVVLNATSTNTVAHFSKNETMTSSALPPCALHRDAKQEKEHHVQYKGGAVVESAGIVRRIR